MKFLEFIHGLNKSGIKYGVFLFSQFPASCFLYEKGKTIVAVYNTNASRVDEWGEKNYQSCFFFDENDILIGVGHY